MPVLKINSKIPFIRSRPAQMSTIKDQLTLFCRTLIYKYKQGGQFKIKT